MILDEIFRVCGAGGPFTPGWVAWYLKLECGVDMTRDKAVDALVADNRFVALGYAEGCAFKATMNAIEDERRPRDAAEWQTRIGLEAMRTKMAETATWNGAEWERSQR